jgi:hypothetical protein
MLKRYPMLRHSADTGDSGPHVVAFVQSCAIRDGVLRETLADLATTDWGTAPIVELDDAFGRSPVVRQRMLVRRILERALRERIDFLLLLEDDLEFNLNLRENLLCWPPLRKAHYNGHFFALLFNGGVRFRKFFPDMDCAEVDPATARGSQALVMSHATVRYLVNCWGTEPAEHVDLRMQRLVARVCPILCHVPSLVQHRSAVSTWGGPPGRALDFDETWRGQRP